MAASKAREWALRAALVAGSVSFCVAAMEALAVLRLVDYRLTFGTLGDEPWRSPLNRLDPELLHLRLPHSHLQGVTPKGDIAFYQNTPKSFTYPYDAKYDSRGFRNDTDLDSVGTLVIGDSFIEGYTVPNDKTLAQQLAQLQGKPVANLGQYWYGPQQELAVLKRYALPLKPKTVIWAFFGGNDITDFRRYADAKAHWDTFAPTLHSFSQRSFTKNLMRVAASKLWKSPAKVDTVVGSCPNGEGGKSDLYFYYEELPVSEKDTATFGEIRGLLAEAHRLTEAAGARLVVAYIPTKFQVYGGLCAFDPDSRAAREWLKPRKLSESLRGALSDISPEIGFVDLTPALQAASKSGKPTYFVDDTHWSVEGNVASARAIHEYLVAHPAR